MQLKNVWLVIPEDAIENTKLLNFPRIYMQTANTAYHSSQYPTYILTDAEYALYLGGPVNAEDKQGNIF